MLVGDTFKDLTQKGQPPVAAQLTKLALSAMCALSQVKTSVSYQVGLRGITSSTANKVEMQSFFWPTFRQIIFETFDRHISIIA